MLKKGIILFIFLTFILWLPLSGQVPIMRFTDPLKDKSLSSDITTSITQDSSGFIWVGTIDGLNCFNGDKINQYKYNINDSTSLVNNTINTMFVDRSGRLWVGTMLGVCIYNKNYDNFITIASEKDFAGLGSTQITSINQNKNGDILISAGNSIYSFNKTSRLFELVFKVPAGNINKFIIDENNNLWIGTSDEEGLIYYNVSEDKETAFLYSETDKNTISNNNIRDLDIFENRIWIATYGGGINAIDLKTFEIKRYPPPDQYAGYITSTYVDNKNNLWTCDHTGLKIYDKENDYFFGYYPLEADDQSIKSSIVEIYQDRQGNYWTIHASGGIGLRTTPKGFLKYDKNPNNYWHTSSNNTTAIEFDAKGNWWIGNGFNGIDIFDWNYGYIRTYNDDPSNPFSLGQGGILDIFKDKNGTMWIGTNIGGLQYYNENEDRFYSYLNDPENLNSIASNDIRSIVQDKEGNLWVVAHGKGIDQFNIDEGIFHHYTNAKNKLANDWAFQALFDSEENLWVATAWGLSKLHEGSDTFESFYNLPSDTNSISHNQVNFLFEDSKKQLWIGTSGGLNKYIPETNNFIRYNPGFTSNNISAIQESEGFIWISTPKGISRFNSETEEVYNFDEKDGLLEGGYHARSVARNGENNIFFGGIEGLTVFNPGEIIFNTKIPDVFITGLQVYYEPVNTYGKGSVLNKQITYTDKLTLKHNQNVLSFEFISNNLVNFEKNMYKYKLEGLDKDWIDIGNENKATYSHLQPGKYTFKVIASNNDNVWNETGASLQIRILNPWYLKWWFKIIIGIITISTIFLMYHLRTASLQKRNKWLALKVDERTQKLFTKNELLKKRTNELNSTNKMLEIRHNV
ncbi:MAG: hypothetical protein HQ541_20860, partial [Mariniphaga sp.]|nr:hypothetical protein [Mariniphaga sp.]